MIRRMESQPRSCNTPAIARMVFPAGDRVAKRSEDQGYFFARHALFPYAERVRQGYPQPNRLTEPGNFLPDLRGEQGARLLEGFRDAVPGPHVTGKDLEKRRH